MAQTRKFVAIDLGASSGRVLLGRWDGSRFDLGEVHRFANGPVSTMGHQHWDVLSIWAQIKSGLSCCLSGEAHGTDGLSGLGIDTWGVDYALLDRDGRLLGNPYHYRDRRGDGMMDLVFERVPRSEIYDATGIQPLQINTLYQLFSMVRADDPILGAAKTLLPMPNLFGYWLSGVAAAEYTDATTTQCLEAREGRWATEMLGRLGIPTGMFPQLVLPGTVMGPLLPEVAMETGLAGSVPVIAVGSHDTASAVAAIPGLDSRSAYISSGTWSLMGVEIAAPIINGACPGWRLHQRRRHRRHDPAPAQHRRAVADFRVPAPMAARGQRVQLGRAARASRTRGAIPLHHRPRRARTAEPAGHAGRDPRPMPRDRAGAAGNGRRGRPMLPRESGPALSSHAGRPAGTRRPSARSDPHRRWRQPESPAVPDGSGRVRRAGRGRARSRPRPSAT
jgi:hypothetical protein